jgi:hypothetical protein
MLRPLRARTNGWIYYPCACIFFTIAPASRAPPITTGIQGMEGLAVGGAAVIVWGAPSIEITGVAVLAVVV